MYFNIYLEDKGNIMLVLVIKEVGSHSGIFYWG